jgi:hypothetical protein
LGLTEARIWKEDEGKERVRGQRVTRAAIGHPQREWLKVYSKWISFKERAFVEKVYEAGLKTQNYDKGFDKFVRKFERNEAMSATVASLSGHREDHGWAVYCTQGPRRCLLLNTEDGLTSEETILTALAAWATFKPRKSSPQKYPGKLFYPTEASHIFEKYWNHLTRLDEHPGFASESPLCKERIVQFSRALSKLRTRN